MLSSQDGVIIGKVVSMSVCLGVRVRARERGEGWRKKGKRREEEGEREGEGEKKREEEVKRGEKRVAEVGSKQASSPGGGSPVPLPSGLDFSRRLNSAACLTLIEREICWCKKSTNWKSCSSATGGVCGSVKWRRRFGDGVGQWQAGLQLGLERCRSHSSVAYAGFLLCATSGNAAAVIRARVLCCGKAGWFLFAPLEARIAPPNLLRLPVRDKQPYQKTILVSPPPRRLCGAL